MRTATIAAVMVAGSALPAFAGITVYTSRAAASHAAGDFVTENFNAQSPGVIADGATLNTGLVQITRDGSGNGGDGLLEIEPGGNFGNIDGTTFLSGETGATPHEVVNVAFSGQNVTAFGADWFSPFSGDGIVLNFGTYTVSLDSITGFNTGFVGFVADPGESFSSVKIAGTEDDITFQELWSADNFSFAVVPAPGAFAVLGMGGLLAARRRR